MKNLRSAKIALCVLMATLFVALAVYLPTIIGQCPTCALKGSSYTAPLAFLLGLASGLSPCFMAILAFLLTYTAGTGKSTWDGLRRTLTFGLGLIISYIIVGIALLSMSNSILIVAIVGWAVDTVGTLLSMSSAIPNLSTYFYISLNMAAGVLMILAGLNLARLLSFPIRMKPFIQKFARKSSSFPLGLFLLGAAFSFIAPCTMPFTVVLIARGFGGSLYDLLSLLLFGIGTLIPLIGVGFIGGFTRESAQKIRNKYGETIRIASGAISVGLGVLLIITVIDAFI